MRRKQAATPAQRNAARQISWHEEIRHDPCSKTERFLSTPRQSPKQSVPDSGGQSGKAAARAPGNFTFELLFNDNGTPTNFSDDKFLDFQVTKEAGQTFDTCEVLLRLTS